MPLTCLKCQSEILVDPASEETVICPNCGSSIVIDSAEMTAGWLPESAPRKLGKFELVEHLGAGAFGAVYKARDTELNRTVALKIPRSGRMFSQEDAERFLREARNAAALRHPCIVDLYDAGQADGVYFLVCEYIQGATLAERLSAKKYRPKDAAELTAKVADALDYAHQHGVVHRDIKPSNIMLDLDGNPHVMDFGLAKRAEEEVHLTLEGQVLGTPAYMSPEQAKGEIKKVNARSDIYSLGVILYELLTGELPFRGQTRMLLAQVIQDEPRPPRRLNDRIPRDLETICLKAMAKQTSSRYPSAGELAADLRRFLAGEPIHARPVGAGERLWRWAQRRPALALLIGVSTAAVLALCTGSLYYNSRLNSALQAKMEQQAKAELNFQKARNAVDQMLTRVGESEELAGIPQWQAYRQKLLEDALEFYQGFLKESDDPAVRREAGRAHARVGRIYEMLGKRRPAIDSIRQAIQIQTQLYQEFPEEAPDAAELAASRHQLGSLYESSGDFEEAEKHFRESLALGAVLTKRHPQNLQYAHQQAVAHRHLAFIMSLTERNSDALKSIDKAIGLLEALLENDNKNSLFHVAYADSCGVKSTMLREAGELDEALFWVNKSIDELEKIVQSERRAIDARAKLSGKLMERAEIFVRANRMEEARKDWERRAKLGEGQVHIDLRMGRAMALAQLGEHAAAVAEIESLIASGLEGQQSLYNSACLFSLAMAAVLADAKLTSEQRDRLAEQYGARAVEILRKGREVGFFTPGVVAYMENDSDLKPLHARQDFQALLTELKQPAASP